MFVKPKIDDEWELVNQESSITPDNLEVDPITCTDVMAVGLPLFIVGFASVVEFYYWFLNAIHKDYQLGTKNSMY